MRFDTAVSGVQRFTSPPSDMITCGSSPFEITASGSIPSIRSKSLASSSVCTVWPITPGRVWGLPFANELWSALAAGFGWSLASEEVQHFYLPSPLSENRDWDSPAEASRVILLVEDNPADVNLIREALDEHQVECKLIHIRDGQRALEFIESLDAEQKPSPDLV